MSKIWIRALLSTAIVAFVLVSADARTQPARGLQSGQTVAITTLDHSAYGQYDRPEYALSSAVLPLPVPDGIVGVVSLTVSAGPVLSSRFAGNVRAPPTA